jgi:hypothetical protein
MVSNMNVFERINTLIESKSTLYGEGNKYTARVYKNKDGTHVAKFFNNGVHMSLADYQHKDPEEVHEFAKEEIARRKKEMNERILEPQGHKESPDKITDDSENEKGRVKKMMGNRTPLEIISKILAGK